MKKKAISKLTLHKITVQNLSADKQRHYKGGTIIITIPIVSAIVGGPCQSVGCSNPSECATRCQLPGSACVPCLSIQIPCYDNYDNITIDCQAP
jgi:hypothetical protein